MGCGCKKRKQLEQAPQTAKIVIVENGEVRAVPESIQPPPPPPSVVDPSDLINKLNKILEH